MCVRQQVCETFSPLSSSDAHTATAVALNSSHLTRFDSCEQDEAIEGAAAEAHAELLAAEKVTTAVVVVMTRHAFCFDDAA